MELGLLSAGAGIGGFVSLITIVGLAWTIAWTGWALWIAAKKDSKKWFIALLVLNTLGILEILYIFIFSKWSRRKKMKEAEQVVSDEVIKEEVKAEQAEQEEKQN